MSGAFWIPAVAAGALVGFMSDGASAGTISVSSVGTAYQPNNGIVEVNVPGALETQPWTTPILLYTAPGGTGIPLVVFCDDLFHYIYVPSTDTFATGPVTTDSNGGSLSPRQSVVMGQIAQIGIDDYRNNDKNGAIAAQAAIWAVEYGTGYISINPSYTGTGYNVGLIAADLITDTNLYTNSSYNGKGYYWGGLIGAATSVQSQIGGVPELSTWAMMLFGFAGLGFAGYRRAARDRGLAPTAA